MSPNTKYDADLIAGSVEEDFLRFTQFYPFFAPYGAPRGDNSTIFANLKQLLMGMLPAKFGYNWPSGSQEEVV